MPRRRSLALLTLLALVLSAAPALGADDAEDDLAPPARARRGGSRAAPQGSSSSSSSDGSSSDGALATAKGGRGGGRGGGHVEETTFVLEHALAVTPGEASGFEPAGVFTARLNYKTPPASGVASDSDAEVRLSHLALRRDPPDDAFREKFSALVDADLNYRVAVPANVVHPRPDERVIAFLPARCLADAGLQEHFALHTDDRGNVVGVDYQTAGGECAADAPAVRLGRDAAFRTTAAVRFYKTAPQLDPDAPTDIRGHGGPAGKKAREEKEQRRRREERNGGGGGGGENAKGERGPPKEQTFWQKNWMYIVPGMFILSNMIAGPQEVPRQGGQGRRGGARKND